MDLRECYQTVGGDYEGVLSRLASEERVIRFLKRYFEKDDLKELKQALSEERWEEAFLHAHNMKGFALNLSLTSLTGTSSVLCEALRGGAPVQDISPLYMDVEEVYRQIQTAVSVVSDTLENT